MCIPRLFVAFLCLLALTRATNAQVEFTHTYPFTYARTVVAEADDPDYPTIYEGAGGGIFVLSGAYIAPGLKLNVANQLRGGGLVRDLQLTGDHLYAAVHHGGLSRFVRDTTSSFPEWTLPDVADAWAVNVTVRVGDIDLVFVGTNADFDEGTDGNGTTTGKSGGELHLVHAPVSGNPSAVDFIELGAPIYSLASMVQGSNVILLVGTACREDTGGPASLVRYDFTSATATLPTSFPSETHHWSVTESSSLQPTFIRDIVIDPEEELAYVAASGRGVYKFDISGTNLTEVTGDDWPIEAQPGTQARFDSIAFLDDSGSGGLGKLLAVASGPKYQEEKTDYGSCTAITSCDGNEGGSSLRSDLAVYEVSDPAPVLLGLLPPCNAEIDEETCMKPALSLAMYRKGTGNLIIHAACKYGLQVVRGLPETSGAITLTRLAEWGADDNIADNGFDSLLVLGDTAFTSFEHGIAAFDVTPVSGQPASDLFSEPVDVCAPTGITLSGALADDGFPTMVFASTLDNGTAFYEVDGDGPSAAITFKGKLVPSGGATRSYATVTLPPGQTPDGHPWLFVINMWDNDTLIGCSSSPPGDKNGSVIVYRIGLTTVHDPGHIAPGAADELGSFLPPPCTYDSTGTFMAGYANAAQGNDVTLWVTYAPRAGTVPELDAGLLALNVHFNANGAGLRDDSVTVTPIGGDNGKVPAFILTEHESGAGFLDYDATNQVIIAAYGCHGVASFDVSSLTALPAVIDKYTDDPSAPARPTSFLDVKFGADGLAYAAGLDGRLWVFDPADLCTFVGKYAMQSQVAALWPTISTVSGAPAFFVAEFGSGLHRIQFQSAP